MGSRNVNLMSFLIYQVTWEDAGIISVHPRANQSGLEIFTLLIYI